LPPPLGRRPRRRPPPPEPRTRSRCPRGSSYAVATGSIGCRELGNNAVRAADLKNNDIRTREVRNGTLAGVDVRDDALTGTAVRELALQTVPSANTAHRADAADTAGRADHAESANVATNIAAPEGFHEIGAAGEPSFNPGCANTFSTRLQVGFYKDRERVIHLRAATPVPTPARPRSTSRPATGPRAARSTPTLACFWRRSMSRLSNGRR
jgi:hypothetical protein